MTETEQRLERYAQEYNDAVWAPLGVVLVPPTEDDLLVMAARADAWSDAHVGAGGDCTGCGGALSPLECGERGAAAEYVETH